ncbi:UDP-glycosyltransferase UGT46B1, partial [Operophtera brumata]
MNCLFILSVIITTCECYRIFCLLPYPGKSHHMVFEPLLDELARRGHNVTTVSFFPAPNPHPNRREVSLVGLADLSIEVIDLSTIDNPFFGETLSHLSTATELAKLNLVLCEKLLYSDVLKEFIEVKEDYDVIIVEHFTSDCMMGLVHNYGLPSVGLSSCAFLPWTPSRLGAPDNPSYVPGMTLPFTDDMTFFERLQNTLIHIFYKWWFEIFIRWEEQRLLERRLGHTLPLLSEIAGNASVVLVNTHHTLNGVRVMPPAFVEVGGIHLHNRTVQPLTEDGFILFSFGTLIRGSTLPSQRLTAILKVFAGLSQRVVWKWENEQIENLPPNVRLLSLTEAVSAGVPTVAVAVLGDQFGNAAHAQRAGGSHRLVLSHLDEASFGAAVRLILTDEKRSEAKLLSQKWRDRPLPPMDTAVFYIEQTARYGGLEMSSRARKLNAFQLALFDVIALLVCVVGTIIASTVYAWRKLKRVRKEKSS